MNFKKKMQNWVDSIVSVNDEIKLTAEQYNKLNAILNNEVNPNLQEEYKVQLNPTLGSVLDGLNLVLAYYLDDLTPSLYTPNHEYWWCLNLPKGEFANFLNAILNANDFHTRSSDINNYYASVKKFLKGDSTRIQDAILDGGKDKEIVVSGLEFTANQEINKEEENLKR